MMIGSGAILATTIDIQRNEGRNFLALCGEGYDRKYLRLLSRGPTTCFKV